MLQPENYNETAHVDVGKQKTEKIPKRKRLGMSKRSTSGFLGLEFWDSQTNEIQADCYNSTDNVEKKTEFPSSKNQFPKLNTQNEFIIGIQYIQLF